MEVLPADDSLFQGTLGFACAYTERVTLLSSRRVRLPHAAGSRATNRLVVFSRLLLLLTGLLLALMPITERVFTWDGFILSGHDLELSLIGVAVFCGLVALCAHRVVMSAALLRIFGQFRQAIPPSRLFVQQGSGILRTGHFVNCLPCRLTPLRI